MSVPNIVPIHKVDVDIFHKIIQNFELLLALKEKSEKSEVIKIHPPGLKCLNKMSL